ncbi:MAG: ketopantoate reductase family protein [Thermodesulfobacteriota bacterium]
MNILLYGAGAVGLGLASALIYSGETVTIVARQRAAAALRREGLIRKGLFGCLQLLPDRFRVCESPAELGGAVYDHILVCTKAYDSAMIARTLGETPGLADRRTKIVLCQNGWGNAEVFSARFDPRQVYNARIITGFQKDAEHSVDITVHADSVRIGSLFHTETREIEALCSSLTRGGIPSEATAAIAWDLWAKMLYNCPLNPLGAIFQVPYGHLGDSPHARNIMDAVIREIFAVTAKAGYQSYWDAPEEYLHVFYQQLIPKTAGHQASMLQDIRGRKPTEIDSLNGAVVRLGERHGIATPANLQICWMVRFLEGRYANRRL